MIKIAVVSYNSEAQVPSLSAVFGPDGGTMGRSKDNDFVLQDPKHYVSRLQASITSDGDRHRITNLSQANPILVNGAEIDTEREYDLQIGDEIQIGLYLLRAEIPQAGDKPAVPRNPVRSPQVSPTNNDEHAAAQSGNATVIQMKLALDATESTLKPPVVPAAAEAKPAAPKPTATPIPQATAPEAKPIPTEPAKITAATSNEPPAANTCDQQALLQAFLKGAGIPAVTLSSGLTPELMELIGKLLSIAVQGTVELSAMRALVKREVNADVTMVVVRNNNPLKFFPDGQTVLTQMLRKKMPGFMGPVEAMDDAYMDLRAHQVGAIAGMRAAMGDLVRRFDPADLEKKMKDRSFLDSMLPATRKSKLWELHTDLYRTVERDARNDVQILFGKGFVEAYESAVERYKDEMRDGVRNV